MRNTSYSFYHFQPNPSRARAWGLVSPLEGDAENRPLIYDLYGSLDELDSLVLSEHDLLDFLVNVTREAPPLHPYVTSRFSDRDTSFLFIGFGFRHWYMRILLHGLKAGGHNSPSLALEDAGFFNLPDQRQTVLFFQSGHFIDFRQLPWQDFTRELCQRFERQMQAERSAQPAVPEPPANAPIAFLCHENRDKPEAERLGIQLQVRGIKIWFDQQSLRGGDNWARLIPHVVEKQTHYVVVLQSPRMLDKPGSYFWREINFALERQSGFGPDLRFVIPVLPEAHPQLPLRDLSRLHMIDLTAPAGIDALAKTILEDWQKRQTIRGA
jgi:TIR domain/SIR2-like domain